MKKHIGYSIDYISNTITVTRKFLDESSVLGTPAFETMSKLRELGMKIEVKQYEAKRKSPHLNYDKMAKYIACVEDSSTYMTEFEAVKKASRGSNNSYIIVWKWFKQKFPNYNNVPEFDDNLKIVVTPANYDKEEPAA